MVLGWMALAPLILGAGRGRIMHELDCPTDTLLQEQWCWDHSFRMVKLCGGGSKSWLSKEDKMNKRGLGLVDTGTLRGYQDPPLFIRGSSVYPSELEVPDTSSELPSKLALESPRHSGL